MTKNGNILIKAIPAILLIASVALTVPMVISSSEAVRLRNSLIFDTVAIDELRWSPAEYPQSFKLGQGAPPPEFERAIADITEATETAGMASTPVPMGGDVGRAFAAGTYLAVDGFKGGRIQSDAVTNLTGIVDNGAGYCADFSQVFNGLAHTLSIPVREWGMSFDGFGGDGHAFNEFYDRQRDRWIFIDSYFSFYVTDRASGEPLSVLELRDRLGNDAKRATIAVVPLSEERFLFESADNALDYYTEGRDQLYLWWGNNVFDYDESTLVSTAAGLSRHLEQAMAILVGVHPQIRIIGTSDNQVAVEKLEQLRVRFLTLAGIGILAFVLLSGQLLSAVRRRRATATGSGR